MKYEEDFEESVALFCIFSRTGVGRIPRIPSLGLESRVYQAVVVATRCWKGKMIIACMHCTKASWGEVFLPSRRRIVTISTQTIRFSFHET